MVSATGTLGSGFRPDSIDRAIEHGARMIGVDAGTTDAGQNALATGKARSPRGCRWSSARPETGGGDENLEYAPLLDLVVAP